MAIRSGRLLLFVCVAVFACATVESLWAAQEQQPGNWIHLQDDQPVTLRFYGSPAADLFTRELEASFQGVLEENFYAQARDGFPAGFISASAPGMPWAGTMWTRDAGTFLRELVMRGSYQHASLLAECLMSLVEKNQQGYYAFPRFFRGSQRGSGSEFDGTGAIIIALSELWQRLPAGNPSRQHIQQFLFQKASPVNYFYSALAHQPLIAGTGEFGCGMRIPGECYNVVQNALVMLALRAVAQIADAIGEPAEAQDDRRLAAKLAAGMEEYLVAKDGSWLWAIDTTTLKPDPAVLNNPVNLGTGSLNGVAAMSADVLGFLPLGSSWKGIQHSEITFQDLYQTPLRKSEFDRYGIWTQTDRLAGGMGSSPSYGQGYATQGMLLFDRLSMAGQALSWLANTTYKPGYQLHRDSPYYFFERTYSPDAVGKIKLQEGCGALNLVNVSEPLKVARLILGVDDLDPGTVRLVPRVPPQWKGVEAKNWPIRTDHGIVRANIQFERHGTGANLTIAMLGGGRISHLKVRMPWKNRYIWRQAPAAGLVRLSTR